MYIKCWLKQLTKRWAGSECGRSDVANCRPRQLIGHLLPLFCFGLMFQVQFWAAALAAGTRGLSRHRYWLMSLS